MSAMRSPLDERRERLRASTQPVNGIDFLEVADETQRVLDVHFVKPLPGETGGVPPGAPALEATDVAISGGERIRDIAVRAVQSNGRVLRVTVDRPGDFSTYTLGLTAAGPGFDPILSAIEFSFKATCPSDFDCEAEAPPAEPPPREPRLDYLAKDFASFRRLMLDRMATIAPDWRDRNAADLGITLVELLAYVGDHLSYQQDAVATEAYLGTARRRVSARRHARLVDYHMHDGCNARLWAQVQVDPAVQGPVVLPAGTRLLTRVAGLGPRLDTDAEVDLARGRGAHVFETMQQATLNPAHHRIEIHDWGDGRAALAKGATRTTLCDPDRAITLAAGDVLVFEEIYGTKTGRTADADRSHRHAVRLAADPVPLEDPLADGPGGTPPLDLLDIRWHAEDALPFDLSVARIEAGDDLDNRSVQAASVARGNIVLADHGFTLAEGEDLDPVPERIDPGASTAPILLDRLPQATRYQPVLEGRDISLVWPYDPAASARAALRADPGRALPSLRLADADGRSWTPKRDLLSSGPDDTAFVAEIEADGTTALRFGDDRFGKRPNAGDALRAHYRLGNGTQGNVGAEALGHVRTDDTALIGVRNPLPALGGLDPETIDEVRQRAPVAFRSQRRAVTADDYARLVTERPDVQRAKAVKRWTGSWDTVFITVDRGGGQGVGPAFEEDLIAYLEPFRMAGHDIEVDEPILVPVALGMHVCVNPEHFQADVKRDLLEVFSSGIRPDGRRGVFHPDNFTFGQPIHLSRISGAAQGVAGVDSVTIKTFARQNVPGSSGLDTGSLTFGRREIAILENNPNFPDRGVLELEMEGGK